MLAGGRPIILDLVYAMLGGTKITTSKIVRDGHVTG